MRTADSRTVLMVDDDADLLGALTMYLELSGVAVRTANSGIEAIKCVADGFIPCLVVLDLRMPVVDGWQAWDRLRQLPDMETVPVVFLSGEPPDYARAARVGAHAYLRKPVTPELLLQTVERYCA
ncbi:MAG: response regulator, partial [Candidatus Binatia bacterium]